MQAPAPTTSGTADTSGSGGFPPFKVESYPSQLFWLAITFTFLFVVLWRFAGPRIQGAIAERRGRINGDLAAAEAHRRDSEAALAAYESALAAARKRAQALADENRKSVSAEIDRAKQQADAEAQTAMAAADARIAATRDAAKVHVLNAARDAAMTIVARLTGETVSPDEAAAAVEAASRS